MLGNQPPQHGFTVGFLGASQEQIIDVERNLRNAELPVRARRIDNEAELHEALSQGVEAMVCSLEHTPVKLSSVLQVCKSNFNHVPVIALTKNPSPVIQRKALTFGIDDVVASGDAPHLERVIRRELAQIVCRRDLQLKRQLLRDAEYRFSTLMLHASDAIAFIHEGMHIHANPRYLELFGYKDRNQLAGVPLLDMVSSADQAMVKTRLRGATSETERRLKVKFRRMDGNEFAGELDLAPSRFEGENCVQVIVTSLAKQTADRANTAARPNSPDNIPFGREHFHRQFAIRLENGFDQKSFATLFYIEVDHFADIRHRIGIKAADRMLTEMTGLLIQASESNDLLARFDEHSFALMVGRRSAYETNKFAKAINATFTNAVFQAGFETVRPTCSIGISVIKGKDSKGPNYMDRAYRACHLASRNGGNQFVFWSDEGTMDEGPRPLIPSSAIHAALENDRFRLVFQPLAKLHGETSDNFAVMVRLVHEDQLITAADFLKQVESAGLMEALDRWIIDHSIEAARGRIEQGQEVCLFVTLSSASLHDHDLPLWINERLQARGVSGSSITFQISENDIRDNFEKAKVLCEELRRIHCRVAVANFGLLPGPRNLLRHLSVDFVKLDASLSSNLAGDQGKQTRLRMLNEEIQDLGLKIIAAGVEDASSISALWQLGVHHVQGHFLQPPSTQMDYEF